MLISPVANGGDFVETEGMRVHKVWAMAMAMAMAMAWTTGCPPPGRFDPDTPDAGAIEEGISADDIGVPCTFDPQSSANPTNQCRGGLECVFVPRSVRANALAGFPPNGDDNTLGMLLPVLEDHFTSYNDDGTDTGFCSLVGTLEQIPLCPLGTVLKGFSSSFPGGIALTCIKPCEVSAECNSGQVCDARYFDESGYTSTNGEVLPAQPAGTLGYCVRPCEVDFPDCARTGFAPIDAAGVNFSSQVDALDATGGRICNAGSGLCTARQGTGSGLDGDPCNSSADCVVESVCIQQDARGFRPADGVGYCARRCYVDSRTGLTGSCANQQDLCQPGLTYGYDVLPLFDPLGDYIDDLPSFDEGGPSRAANGVCFDRCAEGFACREGLVCESVDAEAMQAAWNGQFMCIPEEIVLAGP